MLLCLALLAGVATPTSAQALPTVSFASASQSVDEGSGTHDVEVRMSQAPPTNITFAYTVGGTATPGSDYTALYGTVTVPGGATTATVPVTVIDDSALESSETVVLTLVGSSGYRVGSPGTHTLTIAASDPTTTASFASASQTVDEGAGTRNVEVTLEEAPASDITLAYTVGGTATAGSDYTALSGTVTVAKGATTATIPVTVIDDGAHELDETVVLTLVGGTGYKVGGSAAHTLTIAANDTPTVSFASASQSAGEGAGKRNVKVTLDTTPAPGTSIKFRYTVGGTATSGSDYTGYYISDPPAWWTLLSGVTAATIPVTIIDDSAREGSETVVVKLTGCTGCRVGSPRTHTLTIVDDDGPTVSFASASQSAGEGAGTRNVEVTLEEAPASDIALAYTVGGTATAGSDYAALSGTVAVPGGATTATIPVTIIDDTVREGSETIVLTLAGGAGYRVGSPGTHTLTIVNPVVGISVSSPAPVPGDYNCNGGTWGPKVTEGEPVVFTLTARPAPEHALPVNLRIVSNVLDPSKVRDVHATTTQKTIAIPAGQTSVTYTVPTVDDDVVRTYIARGGQALGGWIDVTILPSWVGEGYTRDTHSCSVVVKVLDNDGPVLAMHAKTNKVVAGDPAMFTIKADLAPTEDLEVSVLWESFYRRSTASHGYKTIAFPAGRSSVTFPVETASNPRDPWRVVRARFLPSSESSTGGYDLDPDRLEEYVNLHNGSGVTVTPGSGVTEGGDAVFTVKATPAPSAPLAVTLTVSQDGDYLPATAAGSHSVTIPVGGSVEYRVATDNDDTDEADGSVTVTPGAVAGYGNLGPATVAVSDDDATTVTLSTPDTTAAEGDAADTASIALALNRGLVRGESLGVSLQFAGGILGTDFTLSAPSPLPAGVTFLGSTVTFAGPRTGQSAASVTLALGAVADALAADRTVTVSIPSSSTGSAPRLTATGLGGGATGVRIGDGQVTLEDATSHTPPDVLPEVSISGGGGGTEGDAVEFFVEADPAPASPLTVTLAVSQDGDFVAADALGQRQVTIPVGGIATVTLTTTNDDADEPDGSVTVTVKDGDGYTVGAPASGTVAIADDDAPPAVATVDPALVAQVRGYAAETREGQAHVDRWRRVLAAFGDDNGHTPMTAAEAQTHADKGWQRWVPVVAALEALEAAPVPQRQPATLPAVSVSAGADVTEGGDAAFTVTANPAPASPLAVTVTVAADGDFGIAAGSQSVTIPTTGSATLTLATADDGADEADGSATVTVTAGDGYTVGSPASGSVSIADDDLPLPAIAVSAGDPVTEGGDATFTVTASPAPASPLAVSVTVAVDGDYGMAAGEQTVTIPTTGSATLTLTTANDEADETDGSVTATVNDGEGYTVGSPASGAVAIADDDPAPAVATVDPALVAQVRGYAAETREGQAHVDRWKRVLAAFGDDNGHTPMTAAEAQALADRGWQRWVPVVAALEAAPEPQRQVATLPAVSVSAGADVTEGGDAAFTVTASPAPAAGLSVTVTVAAAGEFGIAAGSQSVTIPTTGSATLTLATANDDADEPDGSVSVTVAAGNGYTVGSPASGSVSIADDDAPLPAIAVSAGDTVTEGGDATFTVTASPAPASPLAVSVTVAARGDYGIASGTQTVSIPTTGSAVLTLTTADDDADEPDGSVSVTVAAGDGYTVGDPPSGTVAVRDDDEPPPAVTVSAGDAVAEGSDATFTVTASPAPASPLSVTVTVAARGDYGIASGTRTVSVPTTGSAVLTLTTADDDADEADGAASVTVNAGDGYTVGSPASGSVSIADDDLPPPVVSIAAKAASVTEGGDAAFALTADRAPDADLTVTLSVAETGDGDHVAAADEGPATAVIAKGATEAVFSVATVDDDADEPDGSVTVTLKDGEGYAVSPSPGNAAAVTVSDDDAAAVPALSVDDATGQENGRLPAMPFTVRLSAPARDAVRVYVSTRPSTPESATPKVDYEPGSYDLLFRAGETERQVWVMIHDDSHDEEPETFEVVLSRAQGAPIGDGVAVGTIENDDPMPAAWLARFGRAVAEQALDGIAGRMSADRAPGMRGSIAGQALSLDPAANADAAPAHAPDGAVVPGGTSALALAGVAQAFGGGSGRHGAGGPGHGAAGFGSEAQSRSMTAREALLGSSFSLTGATDGSGGSVALWGRTARGGFDGREGSLSLDGTVTTGMLGADHARGKWLVGLALARSEGEGDYRDAGVDPRPASQTCPSDAEGGADAEPCRNAAGEGDGSVEGSLTAAVPYAALRASERLRLWGAVGHGTGDVTLRTAMGGSYRSDTAWSMAAAGLRGGLLALPAGGSGPALAVTSDALWTRTSSGRTRQLAASESDATRLRLGLEGSYRMALGGGGSLVPKLEVGARHDGGDAETGFGVELGGGIAWSDPALGLSLDVSGRALVAHGNDDLKDRGCAASLAFDPDPATGRGPSLSLRQEFGGRAQGGLDALFQPATLEDRAGGGEASSRWTLEAGWGVAAFGGRFVGTPHVGVSASAFGRDLSVGWRLAPEAAAAPGPSLGVEAARREGGAAGAEHGVRIEVSARW